MFSKDPSTLEKPIFGLMEKQIVLVNGRIGVKDYLADNAKFSGDLHDFDIDDAIDVAVSEKMGQSSRLYSEDVNQEALTEARRSLQGLEPVKGSMYQVEIDASPDEFLDWDLPLSQQSEAIQGLSQGVGNLDPDLTRRIDVMESAIQANPTLEEAYRPRITKLKGEIDPAKSTGEQLYGEMTKQWGQNKASAVIGGKGIKGIRYKDEFSRGKEGGTSNYVVFDENLISIARKYGIAIPAAAAMLARQTGQNPQDLYEEDST